MSATCKTCKWWKESKDRYDILCLPYHPGTYERMKDEDEAAKVFGHRVRYCDNPKILFYQRPEKNAAAVVDGSEYTAALLTAEEFGCVLHESVESAARS